jgi:spermidine synthase
MIFPFLVMGITSMLLQITVLRLLLSRLSGNELDIGVTLSFWLIYVGLGSYMGKKIRGKQLFALSFVAVALLALPTDLAIQTIHPALSLAPGETVPFNAVILSTALTLFPLCFLIGLQFPLAVSFSENRYAPEKIYGFEALGAFAGGLLFTFLISSRLSAFDLCIVLAIVNILTALYISKKKLLVLFSVVPLLFYFGFQNIVLTLPWQGAEVVRTAESRYGEIAAVQLRDQVSIYAGGHLAFSYPDPQTEEMTVHLPMTLHPSPRNILIIGGSPGILKEFLKYPVESIAFIELDPEIIQISSHFLTEKDRATLQDRRVEVVIADGRRFMKNLHNRDIDLLILNLPPPYTAGINRFYTTDFFREASSVLKKNGLLVLQMPSSFGYIGRRMQTANGSLYHSLKAVFSHVEVTAEEYGCLFASGSGIDTDAATLENRFVARGIKTEFFHPYIFRDACNPLNTEYVKQRLGKITRLNTDLRPSAYLYNLMLWAEISGGGVFPSIMNVKSWHIILILGSLLLASAFFIFRKKRPVVYCSLFTSGFSGMSFVVAVILTYQALYGYVYEMIGLLAGMFMIGLWTGTVLKRYRIKPLKMLLLIELATITLAILSPLFFRYGPLFYLLIFLSGTITGSQFSAASRAMDRQDEAGKLYGMDLLGSFSGAFISSIIIIPLFGVYAALYLIAAIKAFSVFMIVSVRES